MGGNLPSVLNEYNCVDSMWPFAGGEVVFEIDTSNSPYDPLKLEISANAPIFIFTGCDTDSILTSNTGENINCQGVCIDHVRRGEHFFVFMDWTMQGTYQFSLTTQCLPTMPFGETCRDPIPDATSSGNLYADVCTAGFADDYHNLTSCAQFWNHAAADVIYAFCVAPHGQIQATLYDQCTRFSAMYLFTDCNNPNGSCVAFSVDILGASIGASWANGSNDPKTVYLGLDNACDEAHSRRFGYNASLQVTYDKCPPMGACCQLDGACVLKTEMECAGISGAVWMGYGVPCSPSPCTGLGACCLMATGTCVLKVSESACQQVGGAWLGAGTDCVPDPCVGACCMPGGVCLLRGMQACAQAGGVFRGYGTVCTPNPCVTTGLGEASADENQILLTAVPNPFSAKTAVSYRLPHPGNTHLAIYDASGRLVRTLLSGQRDAGAGNLEWDARSDDGRVVHSGIYFCRLTLDGVGRSRTLIVIP
jgi:hypothetical protein